VIPFQVDNNLHRSSLEQKRTISGAQGQHNDLEKYFNQNTGRLIHKWNHYFEIYDRHLSKFRGKQPTILEFGVSHGGSLQMWKDYFGESCKIYGVDINPESKQFE